MKVWSNTTLLNEFKDDLNFTKNKKDAEILLMGSRKIDLNDFPKCRAIFRAGIGRDNVPSLEADKRNILVRFPSINTIDCIYDETASFTCGLIFRMVTMGWFANKFNTFVARYCVSL